MTAPPLRGPVFDSSWVMVEAAMQGGGVALAPPSMFGRALREGTLARPFGDEVVTGGYWLTRLKSRESAAAMRVFETWLAGEAARPQ